MHFVDPFIMTKIQINAFCRMILVDVSYIEHPNSVYSEHWIGVTPTLKIGVTPTLKMG